MSSSAGSTLACMRMKKIEVVSEAQEKEGWQAEAGRRTEEIKKKKGRKKKEERVGEKKGRDENMDRKKKKRGWEGGIMQEERTLP